MSASLWVGYRQVGGAVDLRTLSYLHMERVDVTAMSPAEKEITKSIICDADPSV